MEQEAQTQTPEEEMEKNFTSISFRSKRNGGPDNDLIALGNRFAEQEENDGVLPTTSLRNLFRRTLRLVTGNATETDIEYFMCRIKHRNNNNPLSGQG